MKRTNLIGLAIVVAVILLIAGYQYLSTQTQVVSNLAPGLAEPVTVTGWLGWEKRGLFEDEEVKRILRQNGYIMNIQKKGSIEMVTEPTGTADYLFPSSKVALAIYEQGQAEAVSSETILYSPIVVYSWRSLLPELEQANLVKQDGDIYTLNLNRLVKLVQNGKSWSDIGVTSIKGRIRISSTDPTKSNSGNMFSAIVANIFADTNDIVTNAQLTDEVLDKIAAFFAKMGLTDDSSGDIFAKFLSIGRSTYPFVVGYESQLIEVINEDKLDVSDIITLYPTSTVWSEHEFIPISEDAKGLMTVLSENERIKEIAWERYGFRNLTAQVDTSIFAEHNIATEIQTAVPVPEASVMIKIVERLQEENN